MYRYQAEYTPNPPECQRRRGRCLNCNSGPETGRLPDIITIAICAVICGADSWVYVEMFGKSKEEWFCSFMSIQLVIHTWLELSHLLS